MKAIASWVLAPLLWLFEGSLNSGSESCDYLARLRALPRAAARGDRMAA